MSRLTRLKTKQHGADGIWAYNEIVRLRAEVDRLSTLATTWEDRARKVLHEDERARVLLEQEREIATLKAKLDTKPTARQWPVMGYGRVAIGGGIQPDGTSALLYLDMGETRPINTDTSDLFPPGEAADPQKLLACIHFRDWGAIQQTIDVLKEMQEELI